MTSEHPAAAQLKQSSEGHPCFHTPHHRRKEKNIFWLYFLAHHVAVDTETDDNLSNRWCCGDVEVMFRLTPVFVCIVAWINMREAHHMMDETAWWRRWQLEGCIDFMSATTCYMSKACFLFTFSRTALGGGNPLSGQSCRWVGMITSLKTIKWDDDCFFNEGKWRWLWSFVLGPMWLNVIAQHVMCREFSLVYLSLLSVSWQQLFIPYSNQWVSLFIGAMFVTTNPFAANNHTAPTHLEFSRLCHQLQ